MTEGIFKQLALLFFKVLDAFFDRALCDHTINENAAILTDSVNTIHRLLLHGGGGLLSRLLSDLGLGVVP